MEVEPIISRNGSAYSRPETDVRSVIFSSKSYPLFDDRGGATIMERLSKAIDDLASDSNQRSSPGRRPQPFNFKEVKAFLHSNVHHSTCVGTKTASLVGLGFKDEEVSKILDPLCDISFDDIQTRAADDFWQTGMGYVEVTREEPRIASPITGMYYLPSEIVHIFEEPVDDAGLSHFHYEIEGNDLMSMRRFADFGDIEDFTERASAKSGFEIPSEGKGVSEVIAFPCSSSLSTRYGVPRWLAATAAIELVQAQLQYLFDFYKNRGVPEFLAFFLGAKVTDADWTKVMAIFQAGVGVGNTHKSAGFNFDNPNMKVQVEKLGLDANNEDQFTGINDALALLIVSAHQVPPLLAGIQIPGKLGATNELPNALSAFQVLLIGPTQHSWTNRWDNTLGNPRINGGLGLNRGQFKYKTILDEINLGMMDTTARMRDPVASGRDPAKGLKD